MTGIIICGLDINDTKIYISNTSPILWDYNINNVKTFDDYKSAKNELEDNFIYLASVVEKTNICSIWLVEYYNNEEIGKERFL